MNKKRDLENQEIEQIEETNETKKEAEPMSEEPEVEKIKFGSEMLSEVVIKNPVLVSTIGLCPVVAICTTLKSAVLLSIITYLTMIFAQVLSAVMFKSCPQWIRVALYTLSGMAIVAPSMLLLEHVLPENMIALGIYLPLLAINPLITRQCERVAVKSSVRNAFINAVCCATGYSAVLLVTGFVRELLGLGTIWDFRVISLPTATALTSPFGGFLILGFMSALLRVYFKKVDPQYAEVLEVESRTSIKKPKQRKEKQRPRRAAQNVKPQAQKENEIANVEPTVQSYAKTNEEPQVENIVEQEVRDDQPEAIPEVGPLPNEAVYEAVNVETLEQIIVPEEVDEVEQPTDQQSNVKEVEFSQDNLTRSKVEYDPLNLQVEVIYEKPKPRKKIVYTNKELEDLMAQSLDELINGTKDGEKSLKRNDDSQTKEVPKK